MNVDLTEKDFEIITVALVDRLHQLEMWPMPKMKADLETTLDKINEAWTLMEKEKK